SPTFLPRSKFRNDGARFECDVRYSANPGGARGSTRPPPFRVRLALYCRVCSGLGMARPGLVVIEICGCDVFLGCVDCWGVAFRPRAIGPSAGNHRAPYLELATRPGRSLACR